MLFINGILIICAQFLIWCFLISLLMVSIDFIAMLPELRDTRFIIRAYARGLCFKILFVVLLFIILYYFVWC